MNNIEETQYEEIKDESLEIKQIEDLSVVEENKELAVLKKDIKEDFQYARKNIKTIIDTGMVAVDNLSELARQTESARLYEGLTTLLQINAVNNTLLLDLDSKFKDMIDGKEDIDDPERSGNITQNNVLFVGTTTDINKIIEDKLKGR